MIIFIGIVAIVVFILACITSEIEHNKKIIKFYQIWLKGDEHSINFIVMSGEEHKKCFISHNNIKFRNDIYTYAVLPFANLRITYKELKELTEQKYLEMCLKVTSTISTPESDE